MATNWLPADEIDACNGDLIIAISKVIADNKILTENHLISSIYLFRLYPWQTKYKNYRERERDVTPSPLPR
jgi:hypothetical protein